jgi:hypothetical protein
VEEANYHGSNQWGDEASGKDPGRNEHGGYGSGGQDGLEAARDGDMAGGDAAGRSPHMILDDDDFDYGKGGGGGNEAETNRASQGGSSGGNPEVSETAEVPETVAGTTAASGDGGGESDPLEDSETPFELPSLVAHRKDMDALKKQVRRFVQQGNKKT